MFAPTRSCRPAERRPGSVLVRAGRTAKLTSVSTSPLTLTLSPQSTRHVDVPDPHHPPHQKLCCALDMDVDSQDGSDTETEVSPASSSSEAAGQRA